MYRWTDPIDPDDASRRPEPSPTDNGPAWPTGRPEPQSSYLFGDEPAHPPAPRPGRYGDTGGHGDTGRYGDTGGYGYGPAPDARPTEAWPDHDRTAAWPDHDRTAAWPGHGHPQPGYDAAQAGYGHAQPGYGAGQPAYGHPAPFEPVGAGQPGRDRWNGEEQPTGGWDRPEAAWQPATDVPVDDSRHRQKRRLSRPLVIGGAAAVATLAVSLGVGAVLLPDGDGPAERTAADAPLAVAPDGPEQTGSAPPADALVPESASPSAVPTTVKPKPSPTKKIAPKPSRTTAPSRQRERDSTPSSTAARTTSSSGGLSAELQQVVDLVNQERAKAGCKALSVDTKLTLAAQRHSQDQADHKKMTHDGSDGSNVGQRLDRVGYAWRAYGENVAWNQQSPASVMDAWMNSEGHRANILNCGFTQIGVGVARSNGPYWTQDFGTPR
ncbi:CAP domain-containing protein [Micromonospora sp. WMMD975]|uniref:CAP domain-containing protein n=1 Tax=Micromonospora sp. WMMD975 TaxID=3016087 RepID=UPI002499FEBF|nr:CAP domain-containing protein [Micromonospora sp. WMMD975]WFE34206.1 CAP domain-containing protein [Micromonospora sp. WMMD975]